MRCDRAVTLLATGGMLGRWLARRHAAHCPTCAADTARLRQVVSELSAVEPLSAAHRALWSSVSTEPRPTAARPARFRPALLVGSAAAGILVVGLIAAIVARRPSPGPTTSVAVPDLPVVAVPDVRSRTSPATVRELDDLKAQLRALSQDVAQLRRRAELLDERRDAEVLSRRFNRSVALRDSLRTPLTLTWDADSLPMGPRAGGVAAAPACTPVGSGPWGGHPCLDTSPPAPASTPPGGSPSPQETGAIPCACALWSTRDATRPPC